MCLDMKAIAKTVIVCLGIVLVIGTFMSTNIGSADFFFTLILAGGLVITPFAGLGLLLGFILTMLTLLGTPFIGALIGVEITGKDGVGPVLGFIVGGVLGCKLALSDSFGKLADLLGELSKHDKD